MQYKCISTCHAVGTKLNLDKKRKISPTDAGFKYEFEIGEMTGYDIRQLEQVYNHCVVTIDTGIRRICVSYH